MAAKKVTGDQTAARAQALTLAIAAAPLVYRGIIEAARLFDDAEHIAHWIKTGERPGGKQNG